MRFLKAIKDRITGWLGHKALSFAMSSILKSMGIPNTPEVQAAMQQILAGVLVLAAAYQSAKTPETTPPGTIPPEETTAGTLTLAQQSLINYIKKHPEHIPDFIIQFPELAPYVQ